MYLEHFGLGLMPFSIAPDPRFLFMSARHREALAHLLWGLQTDGGFVLLTGEVGTGKTTLSRSLLEQLPDGVDLAFVLNPKVTVTELLETICEELGAPVPEPATSNKRLVDAINSRLLDAHANGRRVVLIVDEAQNLSTEVLEQIRLLTNLETNDRKLLQIILLGQPELADLLARDDLRQLAQRITARYHLDVLDAGEMSTYVTHRMMVAGSRRQPFTAGALRALHRLSRGVPRVANVIADRALLGAWAAGRDRIDAATVRRAAAEVEGERPGAGQAWPWPVLAVASVILVAAGTALWWPSAAPELAAPEPTAIAATGTRSPSPVPPAADTGPAASAVPSQANGSRADPRAPATDPSAASVAEPAAEPVAQPTAEPTAEPMAEPAQPATDLLTASQPAAASTPQGSVVFLQDTEDTWLTNLWAARPEAVERDAFLALTRAWNTPFELRASESPCEAVGRVGLACSRQDGNLRRLLDTDRPALLRLWMDGESRARTVALLAASGDELVLGRGEARLRTDRATLERFWKGEAQVLWQMPEGYRYPIGNGERSATVRALRRQLGRATGQQLGASDLFDDELERLLAAYQRSQGLTPDGIAGPDTWIRLNRHLEGSVPRLVDPEAS